MTDDEAHDLICTVLTGIAPEVDPATIDPDVELGPELDLDSMDFLNLVEGVCASTGLEIPEHDYPQILTLHTFQHYLTEAVAQKS
jgi:acyl carrier protein